MTDPLLGLRSLKPRRRLRKNNCVYDSMTAIVIYVVMGMVRSYDHITERELLTLSVEGGLLLRT